IHLAAGSRTSTILSALCSLLAERAAMFPSLTLSIASRFRPTTANSLCRLFAVGRRRVVVASSLPLVVNMVVALSDRIDNTASGLSQNKSDDDIFEHVINGVRITISESAQRVWDSERHKGTAPRKPLISISTPWIHS